MFIINPYIFGSGYTIENAIWLDGSADYLTKTFAGAGTSRVVYTVSFWARQNTVSPTGGNNYVFDVGPSSGNSEGIRYTGGGDGSLYIQATDGTEALNTGDAARFRDLTAWQHVVWSRNTGNADGDKTKLYVNGVRITAFDSSYGTRGQNLTANGNLGGTDPYSIGRDTYGGSVYYNGYLAEFVVIDGTEYAASDFGESDDNGVWVPVDPSGLTYGDNGFLLQFKQNGSGQDADGIGADTSGKTNHFAVGGGAIQTNQVTDTPTDDASSNIGNYATINPLNMDGGNTPVISNGNTTFTRNGTASDNQQAYATQVAVGKKYFEFLITGNSNSVEVGWASPGNVNGNQGQGPTYYGGEVYFFQSNAAGGGGPWPLAMIEGAAGAAASTNTSLDSSEITTTPRLKFAIDTDAKKYWLGVVHGSYGGWCNTSGVGGQTFSEAAPTGTWTSDKQFLPYVFAHAQTGAGTFYFRDADWTDSAPSGFTSLNTANLPAPTVADPSKYFATVTYTGDTNNNRNITGFQDGAGNNVTPDLVWIKGRSNATSHYLQDVVRGFGGSKELLTDSTSAEGSQGTGNGYIGGVVAGGFTAVDGGTNDVYVNENSRTYVAWCWKAGDSNTAVSESGSGTGAVNACTHRANTTSGFSIIKYTGFNDTISNGEHTLITHGLGSPPVIMIGRSLDSAQDWFVLPGENGGGTWSTDNHMHLNTTDGSSGALHVQPAFPSSTAVKIGNDDLVNKANDEFIMYAWIRVPGLVGYGTFVGANATDGNHIVMNDGGSGFSPAWFMFKNLSGNGSWYVVDSARNPENLGTAAGTAKLVIQEVDNEATVHSETSNGIIDFVANGVKFRGTNGSDFQGANTFMYLAFAEDPFGGDGVAQAKAR